MKFRMFTAESGRKIALNAELVADVMEAENGTVITMDSRAFCGGTVMFTVREDFDVVLARLDMIAE